jgi:hypothetical protein
MSKRSHAPHARELYAIGWYIAPGLKRPVVASVFIRATLWPLPEGFYCTKHEAQRAVNRGAQPTDPETVVRAQRLRGTHGAKRLRAARGETAPAESGQDAAPDDWQADLMRLGDGLDEGAA